MAGCPRARLSCLIKSLGPDRWRGETPTPPYPRVIRSRQMAPRIAAALPPRNNYSQACCRQACWLRMALRRLTLHIPARDTRGRRSRRFGQEMTLMSTVPGRVGLRMHADRCASFAAKACSWGCATLCLQDGFMAGGQLVQFRSRPVRSSPGRRSVAVVFATFRHVTSAACIPLLGPTCSPPGPVSSRPSRAVSSAVHTYEDQQD